MACSVNHRYARAPSFRCVVGWLALIGQACGVVILPLGCGAEFLANRLCSPPLAAALITDRFQLYGADGPEGQATLRAVPLGGEPPYTYQWYVLDPAGENADFLLDAPDSQSPRLTAGEMDGPFDVFCTVTDNRGCSYTDKIVLTVGTPVGLDLTTERFAVAAGGGEHGQTTLHLAPLGGPPPYQVSWMVTGPDGNVDNDRLEIIDPFAPRFTSATRVGTYVVTATIMDATRASSVESIIVVVGQHLGLDVISSRSTVMPGGGDVGAATLLATPIGGKEPYVYNWDVVGPEGDSNTELLDDPTLRSPLFESQDQSGHFLVRCTVTDADGNVMVGSTAIIVGQQLAIDLSADRLTLAPGRGGGTQASLSADVRGGRAPISVSWSVTLPGGQIDNTFLGADMFDATFSATELVGTFVVRCTATDAEGVSATDSLRLIVRSPLSLDVTADRIFVPPLTSGTPITVTAAPFGGEGPYDYVWSAMAGGSFLDDTTETELAGKATNRWWMSTTGTYTISCTVTDSAGQSFFDSVTISVTAEVLSLNVTGVKLAVNPGEVVNLVADRSGGTANFSYAWSSQNESGSTAGTLGATSQSNLSDDATNSWTAPTGSDAEGTYRIHCTVTDAVGVSATDTAIIEVTARSVQNVFLSPAATDTSSVLAAINISGTAETPNPDPGHRILPADGLKNPAYPRNVVIAIVDVNDSIAGGTARVTGFDARGQTQSEIISIAASVGGFSLNTGVVPFATVTEVDLFSFNGITAFTDQVAIGVGNKFGLTGVLDLAGDVLYVKEGSTVLTSGYTVDITSGRQGITFASAPNAAMNYTVVFRSR